jgi:prepilin-type N-terminal cleavage/methylation domain-containing protein
MKIVKSRGYTIIELMMVIAISSAMFVVVAISFGGRQQQVQFTQAVRDFDSKLKDIMNDVSTGYFPDYDTPCRATGSGPGRRPNLTVTVEDIGENSECILVGKAIQFTPLVNNGVNDNGEFYKVYNVVGLRIGSSGSNPITLAEAVPVLVPDAQTNQLRGSLRVTKIISSNPPSSVAGGIGIYTSFNRSGGILASSTNESLQVGVVPGSALGTNENDFKSDLDTQNISVFNSTSRSQTYICLSDPSNDRNAYIVLGGSGSQVTSTIVEFENVAICA